MEVKRKNKYRKEYKVKEIWGQKRNVSIFLKVKSQTLYDAHVDTTIGKFKAIVGGFYAILFVRPIFFR